ncbi:Gfo/Idh/MocA family protein [Streptomyces sp. H27-D2]|uniref:Gfo/Idh/MocA family protein n=1 Tax=Streptomyces sp. H27-D2 TaxID=3046304 RepID=UPI002DBF83D6|nr:Gfo/Idh/MocA family oxidoreductase [Streptomyces sp. H27-D2]MEC4017106.1 Gfo/Idh/MocA family oxidoreductase [Streptomyces sp. H27-D2]
MKIALLGTGFGQAHAAVYAARPDINEVVVFGRTPEKLKNIADKFGFATTTDLDALITDPSVDLVDVCLPTPLHADVAVRVMEAGKDVLVELPLATTLDDAQRVIDTATATGRHAFVDMFSRFSPANEHLHQAVADQRYGRLKHLEVEGRTALMWEGYQLGLDSLALDMMHADFDLVTSLLGAPDAVHVAGTEGPGGRGSAADVVLGYRDAGARCTSSSLMPKPYGMRGGYRATFTGAVLEHTMSTDFNGPGAGSLTAYTLDGEKPVDLADTSPYAAMIGHVLDVLAGRSENRIAPTSALDALRLTLDVHHRLTGKTA